MAPPTPRQLRLQLVRAPLPWPRSTVTRSRTWGGRRTLALDCARSLYRRRSREPHRPEQIAVLLDTHRSRPRDRLGSKGDTASIVTAASRSWRGRHGSVRDFGGQGGTRRPAPSFLRLGRAGAGRIDDDRATATPACRRLRPTQSSVVRIHPAGQKSALQIRRVAGSGRGLPTSWRFVRPCTGCQTL